MTVWLIYSVNLPTLVYVVSQMQPFSEMASEMAAAIVKRTPKRKQIYALKLWLILPFHQSAQQRDTWVRLANQQNRWVSLNTFTKDNA